MKAQESTHTTKAAKVRINKKGHKPKARSDFKELTTLLTLYNYAHHEFYPFFTPLFAFPKQGKNRWEPPSLTFSL